MKSYKNVIQNSKPVEKQPVEIPRTELTLSQQKRIDFVQKLVKNSRARQP